jgi:hypothetical protein
MPETVTVYVPGLDKIDNKLGLLIDRFDQLVTAMTIEPEQLGEGDAPEDPLDDLIWLVTHDVHVMIGVADEEAYVRVLPVSGIPQRTLKGPIDRSLRKLRGEVEKIMGGRR